MMRFFDNIEFTTEEEEALTEAAENTPLDDPELEAAVQEARSKFAAERNAKKQPKTTQGLPAGGQ